MDVIKRFNGLETVCFVGDSITQDGSYMKYLHAFYLSRFPHEKFIFHNCGTGGDNARSVLNRLENDVLCHNPQVVTIMLGMNDMNSETYGMEHPTAAAIKSRQEVLDKYEANIIKIIETLLSHSIKVILITPTPYDQTMQHATENQYGKNHMLAKCSDLLKAIALKYTLPLIDFHEKMTTINETLQISNPTLTIISEDRTHPQEVGHLIMAYLFLSQKGMKAETGRLIVNAGENRVEEARHCEADHFRWDANEFSFNYRPRTLPMLLDNVYEEADRLVPLSSELNLEMLQVKGLPNGLYELIMEGGKVAVYTSGQLNQGVNLAVQKENPGQKRTAEVHKLLNRKAEAENLIRNINMIERDMQGEIINLKYESEYRAFRDYYLKGAEGYPWYEYCKNCLNQYIIQKPLEENTRLEIKLLNEKLNLIDRVNTYEVVVKRL